MELVTTYCDVCNPRCLRNGDGSGYAERDEEACIELGWLRLPNGQIACLDCQDKLEAVAVSSGMSGGG